MQHWTIGGLRHRADVIGMKGMCDKYKLPFSFSIYDSPRGAIWTGGRHNQDSARVSIDEFLRMASSINANGIGVNLTFSNSLLGETHLDDRMGNLCLERLHRAGNGVIVNSPTLLSYVKENFPKFTIIQSVTACRRDLQFYLDMQDIVDVLVLPIDVLRQTDFITKLDRGKIEIMVNSSCLPNCKHEREHYKIYDQMNLGIASESDAQLVESWEYCQHKNKHRIDSMTDFERIQFRDRTLTFPEFQILKQNDVMRYKVVSREVTASVSRDLVKYIIEWNGLNGLLTVDKILGGNSWK